MNGAPERLGVDGPDYDWMKCRDCGCAWPTCDDSTSCPECGSHNHDFLDDLLGKEPTDDS
jgi:hypothetical protein